MKRESSKNAKFPFCGQTKGFRYEIVTRAIQPCFLHQGTEIYEETSGTFYTLWKRKVSL